MDRQDFEAAVAAEVSKRLRMAAEGLRMNGWPDLARDLEEACGPAPSGDVNARVERVRKMIARDNVVFKIGMPEGMKQRIEDLGRELAATQTAVATCASCGGNLGGCYYTRKTDGKAFCLACGDAGVPEEYHNHCAPHPDSPAPNPPPAPQPPRSRCCNTDTFTTDGRTICSRCRLGCRTR